jgi:hypothetical protein
VISPFGAQNDAARMPEVDVVGAPCDDASRRRAPKRRGSAREYIGDVTDVGVLFRVDVAVA